MNQKEAEEAASKVFKIISSVMDNAAKRDVLKWLAYSDRIIEQWFSVETYVQICKKENWENIVPQKYRDYWDSWMEAEPAKSSREYVDITIGVFDKWNYSSLKEPRYVIKANEAVCFEFKVIRDDNIRCCCQQLIKDINKAFRSNLKYAYAILIFYFKRETEQAQLLNCLNDISGLESIGSRDKFDWKPHLEYISKEDSERSDMYYAVKNYKIIPY